MLPKFVNPDEYLSSSWANNVVSSIRSMPSRKGKTVINYISRESCPFGKLVTIPHSPDPSTKGIKGGLITCGNKNFNVTDYDLGDTLVDGNFVVYITIPCESNMDDDSELILPRILTSSLTAITDSEWTVGESYPVNTNPTVASVGIGTFIFPVGSFSVTDGKVMNFSPTACGTCYIDQCAGILTHTRGNVEPYY